MSKRTKIVKALNDKLNDLLNGVDYTSNIYSNSHTKVIFWDEVNQFPYVSVVAGSETVEYLPGNFKWGYLTISIRIFDKDEDVQDNIEQYIEDIEAILDANNSLVYDTDNGDTTELISVLSIDTDQGLMAPIGVAEINIQVQYDK